MKNGSLVVVNTLPQNDSAVQAAIDALTGLTEVYIPEVEILTLFKKG